MDDKGRLAFPSPLRGALEQAGAGDRFILTQSLYEACLVAMPEAEFRAAADKVRALPSSSAAVSEFKRVVIASATLVVIDKAGRASVPKELRDYAGLERDAVWAGVVDKIELWSKGRWDERNQKRLADPLALEKMREVLEQHGL